MSEAIDPHRHGALESRDEEGLSGGGDGLRQLDHQPVALGVTKPKSAGCPRCRLDRIKFGKEVKLPRFSFKPGEEWELPQSRYTPDGSAELGGGIIPRESFEIIEADESRAFRCDCGRTT